jgi:hypothetical protein
MRGKALLSLVAVSAVAAACGNGRSKSGASVPNVAVPIFFGFTAGSDSPDGTPTPTPVTTDTSPDGTPTPTATATDTSPDGTPTPTSTATPTPTSTPCSPVVLVVTNQGVSSALVEVNGLWEVPPSSFPTGQTIVKPLDVPEGGVLHVEAKVNGSPSDKLRIRIESADGATVYLDQTITRAKGRPVWHDWTVVVPGC